LRAAARPVKTPIDHQARFKVKLMAAMRRAGARALVLLGWLAVASASAQGPAQRR